MREVRLYLAKYHFCSIALERNAHARFAIHKPVMHTLIKAFVVQQA